MQNGGSKAVRHKTHGTTDAPKASQQGGGHRSPGSFRRGFQRVFPQDSHALRQQIAETLAAYAAVGLENHPDAVADLAPLREALALLEDTERQEAFSASYFPEDCYPRNILSTPMP